MKGHKEYLIFSLNSKISSELKLWESLQNFQKVMEKTISKFTRRKIWKPSNPDFEMNMLEIFRFR